MGLGYVAFEADGRRISADAKDVNPIRISFKVESQTPGDITWKTERDHVVVIPGPLEIKRTSVDNFLLSYPLLGERLSSLPPIRLEAFGLNVTKAADSDAPCAPRVPLPISEMAALIMQQFPQVPGL